MTSFYIKTLGCKANQHDSEVIAKELIKHGLRCKKKDASIIIINSCAVTQVAIRKNQHAIKTAKKLNPVALIYVVGCWPRSSNIKNKEGFTSIDKSANNPHEIVDEILSKADIGTHSHDFFNLKIRNKARYFIKIQDGCEQYCSYCNIPFARGRLYSRDERDVVSEIAEATGMGYGEIVLCGIHLGLFGVDTHKTKKLGELLKKICKLDSIQRIRLSSIEVNDLNNNLIKIIANNKKICEHLHVPLQSGCDKILKLMNRPYSAFDFEERIKYVRKQIPEIAISTDIIVGFPGECAEDFKNTCDFAIKIGFSKIHVFPYSPHPNTRAARFSGQVNEKVKAERAKTLRGIAEKLKKDFDSRFIGKTISIVAEKKINDYISGKSEYHFNAIGRIKNGEPYKKGKIIDIITDSTS